MVGDAASRIRYFDVEYTVRGATDRVTVGASSPQEALERARRQRHWGRNFRVLGQPAEASTPRTTRDQIMSNLLSVAVADLRPSGTQTQAERRAHYNQAALRELGEDMKANGQLQTIVARPVNGAFEIIAGERRWAAAKLVGIDTLNAVVGDFPDDQVEVLQLSENLQREHLNEMAEAIGYQSVQKTEHLSLEQLAQKFKKTKSYVAGRLKLLALGKDARKAFFEGRINASVALLLARIPVEKLQKEALTKLVAFDNDDRALSYRQAADFIHREYTLRLADAPFPTDDETLCKGAVACGRCPKRTGNQPELFADVKGPDVCTDPTCFKAKREAWADRQLEQAKQKGQQIIAGEDAKRIARWGADSLQNGYAKPGDRCWEDPKQRTYRQILGKDARTSVLKVPGTGEVIEVIEKSAATKKLKADGVIKPVKKTKSGVVTKAAAKEKEDQGERTHAIDERVLLAIHAKESKKKPTRGHVTFVLGEFIAHGDIYESDLLQSVHGLKYDHFPDSVRKQIGKLSDAAFDRLLMDLPLLTDWRSSEKIRAEAKRLKVDVKAIERAVDAEFAKPTAAASATKTKPAKHK